MAPPQLPAHRPVALLAQPVEIALGISLRIDPHGAARHRVEGGLGDLIHADEPLVGEVGLDRRLRAVGMREFDDPVFHLHELARGVEIGHHLRAGFVDREARVGPGLGVQRAVGVQNVDHRQALPAADVVVVGIVGRGDLHAARAHLRLCPFVGHERDRAAKQRQPHAPASAGHRGERLEEGEEFGTTHGDVVERPVDLRMFLRVRLRPLLAECSLGRLECGGWGRMDGHGRVAEERLGPRRRHGHARRLTGLGLDDVVANVPEVALHLLVKDFVVADRRLQERVPVHEPLAAAHEAFLEEAEERLADGRRALVVEREPGAIPVAARPEVTELAEDPLLILLLPSPDAVHELLASEVVPRELLLLEEPPLDDRLRGDARVVGAGHPERAIALHPPRAHEHVLERVVEGVAEVERARHVGRRDDHREHGPRVARGSRLCMPGAGGIPEGPATSLGGLVVVLLRQFVHDVPGLENLRM